MPYLSSGKRIDLPTATTEELRQLRTEAKVNVLTPDPHWYPRGVMPADERERMIELMALIDAELSRR